MKSHLDIHIPRNNDLVSEVDHFDLCAEAITRLLQLAKLSIRRNCEPQAYFEQARAIQSDCHMTEREYGELLHAVAIS